MVLAHLRGLLQPAYPHGVRSRIREELVLRGISREVDADSFKTRAIVEAVCMSAVAAPYRAKLHRDAMQFLTDANMLAKLLDFDIIERKRPKLENQRDVKELLAAFDILRETDVFHKMDALCKLL